ncbi:MAG TPA: xylose isomerase [Thermoleophilaceae bacterium]|nr:xylose isomerase [Thermoleophilaceae bacterium]
MADLTPRPQDKFTFGLWTVGHKGNDPFGVETRPGLKPADSVRKLAELGAYGVCFHDNDLIPLGTGEAEAERLKGEFKAALDETGMKVSMATTNLFTHPVFKDGAFTSNDRDVRRYAIQKTMRGIDLGAELGAPLYIFWGGREGVEADAAKPARDALERFREALDFLCGYVLDQGYDMRIALEPKPNEPRGDIFLPTVGHMLAFIERLDHAEMVGVNPEVAHETMAGLSFLHAVAQAQWAGKLFHIDLNGQRVGRYDQDFRFGAVGIKDAFFLVKLLEDSGYDGARHFDARPLRVESEEGIWDFAAGCMRTYLALKTKAEQWSADAGIQAALEEAKVPELALETVGPYSKDKVDELLAAQFDLDALGARETRNERLDQLSVDLILGLR